ncbi:MAG: hypothetical protein JO170_04430, partial [Verrucomicrobia bacterium]|nr:hypothetical protein [Verrucomicrobiota bacterium]
MSDYPVQNPPNKSQDSRTWRFLSQLPVFWFQQLIYQGKSSSNFPTAGCAMIGGGCDMFASLLPRDTYEQVYQNGPDVIIAGSAQRS